VRRRISSAWWAVLGRAGLDHARWRALPHRVRRGVKTAIWLAIFLLLVWKFGVWKTSALAIAAVVVLLLVPPYQRLQVRGVSIGRWVVPAAVLAIAVAYPY
jgi:hypothetical protein